MARTREPLGITRLDMLWGLALGVAVEALTCVLRFAFHFQSTRDTAHLGRFTLGYRVHHGYLGVVVLAVLLWSRMPRLAHRWIFRVGLALLVSDLFHHFVVLWITTGSPQFDFTYPR